MPHNPQKLFQLACIILGATTCSAWSAPHKGSAAHKSAAHKSSPPPKSDEWILQQHLDGCGNLSTCVSKDAVKITNVDSGYQVVAKAPGWTVHCFRTKEKCEWVYEPNQFVGEMLENPGGAHRRQTAPVEQKDRGFLHGLHYKTYSFKTDPYAAMQAADDISASPQAIDFLCRFYNLPNPGKVPLYQAKVSRLAQAKIAKDWLDDVDFTEEQHSGMITKLATKSWKKVSFNPNDFNTPHGFKVVSDPTAVTFSGAEKSSMDEMFGDGGTVPDSKKKKK
jgi:hypothetical protein